jgi:hypothetical protein
LGQGGRRWRPCNHISIGHVCGDHLRAFAGAPVRPRRSTLRHPHIAQESGRGGLEGAALADGSSWRCPHCAGVVPVQRQQAHLAHWCPQRQC